MSSESLRFGLEDLLADLEHARRSGDLGRLALLSYCELRRWARVAARQELADHANRLFLKAPYANRESFLRAVDQLIEEAKEVLHDDLRMRLAPNNTSPLRSADLA
ncbi:MAG TPA: hypothetical protein VFP68_22930 [Burkholderiaceae bacterium]|nr:hypothetical protein [Burkholderiaceae bacterium]